MRFLKILTISVGLVAAFGAGVILYAARDRNFFKVTLVNRAEQPIESFTVRYTTCGNELQITGGALEVGTSRVVGLSVCGKGHYTVEGKLKDGRVLQGGEGYVQSRYSTVNITAKSIDSISNEYAL